MYRESKILTIYSASEGENVLKQKRTSDILQEIEIINLYLKDFKNGVCDKILSSTIELIYQSHGLNVPDELLETVLLNINNIFIDNKITVFLNSQDIKLIDIYAEGFRDSIREVNIFMDDNIDIGTCKFDYDFTKIKSDILDCLRKSQLLIDDYKGKKFVSNEYLDLQAVVRKKIKNESEVIKNVQEFNLSKLCNVLTNEDPYIIAVVLMNLNVLKSIELLWRFPINLRYEVVHRLLTTKQISNEIVEVVFKTVISELEVDKAVFNENIKHNRRIKRKNESNIFSLAKKKY